MDQKYMMELMMELMMEFMMELMMDDMRGKTAASQRCLSPVHW